MTALLWPALWTVLLERLQRFCEGLGDHATVITEPELAAGSHKLMRSMRRHHRVPFLGGQGSRRIDIRRLIEDPMPVRPDSSYWLQLADWNAHAALRSEYVEPVGSWSRGLWDLLGNLRLSKVNKLRGGPPGIVEIPKV